MNVLRSKWQQKYAQCKNAKWVRKMVAISRLFVLPGFERVPLYDVMRFFVESLIKGQLFQRTSALTYHIFIALVPILMALFSLISFLGDSVKESLIFFIESITPDYVFPAISNVIEEVVTRQNGTLLSFSFVFGLLLSYFCVNAIVNILNTTYFNLERRPFFNQLLVNIGLLMGTILIVLLLVVIFSLTPPLLRHINSFVHLPHSFITILLTISKWVLIFALVYALISSFYYFAPINKKYFRFFSAGSTFCSISMVLLLWVMNIYFSNFSNYNIIYGSIGALFAILMFIYWNCFIFLVGFDLNVSIHVAKEK